MNKTAQNKVEILSSNHWQIEDYKQRITTAEWKKLLLGGDTMVICRGHVRELKARYLGAGVYEIYKEPLKE